MTPLLTQFLSEAREFLQGISEMLMQLEKKPGDADLMNKLFRLVHTLKGNTGLFDFPEMTRVLHAGEDLMDEVKSGGVPFSQDLADKLLNAMDFVSLLCDEIESEKVISSRADDSVHLADALRGLIARPESEATACADGGKTPVERILPSSESGSLVPGLPSLADIPETVRMEAYRSSQKGDSVYWIAYKPEKECFFNGDDPFFTVRQTPGLLWGRIVARESWPLLAELDAYSCNLDFHMLAATAREELNEHFRYVMDRIHVIDVEPSMLVIPNADPNDGPVYEAENTPQLLSEEDAAALETIFANQRQVLMLDDRPAWRCGRLKAVAAALSNCCMATNDPSAQDDIQAALDQSLITESSDPLLAWLENRHSLPLAASLTDQGSEAATQPAIVHEDLPSARNIESPVLAAVVAPQQQNQPVPEALDETPKFGRRAEDAIYGSKVLKVDQAKIDRLMNLIGEMVVSKNALPYLAQRAENQYGVRELSREIKAQYAVINRIAEEMQDGIMQVRMMPVSFIFQRFPRLVRDLSRKLGKEIQLVLDGEDTEADKNIIESLADPLIHIIRNSLDHGLETPDVRLACGKPETGTLTIRAAQEADRVIIEIIDDGRGIDPATVKRKAYEKGIIDEAALERISDREAINLVFAPGFSTVETVSDISGRGVGMDVVRNAVAKVNGAIALESSVGKGTHIRISLPLSMAVTKVMIIETDRQIFGVPMDHVMETVRVPRSSIHTIKQSQTVVLRGRLVPLKSLNLLLNLDAEPKVNTDDELAMLVARVNGQVVGIMVDDFRETVDVIQKPLNGVLSGLTVYSGSALMGDGSVLMVLNLKEIL